MPCEVIFALQTPLRNLPPSSRKIHRIKGLCIKQTHLLEVKSIKYDCQTFKPRSVVPCGQSAFSYLPFHANLFYSTYCLLVDYQEI